MIYPKNKILFRQLIHFAKKVISVCNDAKINPVIYGSFAHFYHTRDRTMNVNDIDLWIPEKRYPELIKQLEKNNIKYEYLPRWHTLIIKKGKLKVEVDSMDYYYRDTKKKPYPKSFTKVDFYGKEIRIMKLNILEKFYEVALMNSTETKNKVKRKIKALERFLGRELKWKTKG